MKRSFRSLGVAALLLALPSKALGDELRVQVNQVALEREGTKKAIVEYSGSDLSGRFEILQGERIVFSGELSELQAFDEWSPGTNYFEADFSALKDAGTYRVRAKIGQQSALSPEVRLADGALFSIAGKALVDYFRLSRHTDPKDKRIRVYGTQTYRDVSGGWKDAGGDNGKYLSHLSYANFFNPQQAGLAAWALSKSHELARPALTPQDEAALIRESNWGADFLYRMVSRDGYFYMTVFDRWGIPNNERVITAYVGRGGYYTEDYHAAYREGAGVAIAALARASRLPANVGGGGQFSRSQYLEAATRAFAHLEQNNLRYVDDGKENIIDDYTALLAAVELYRSTRDAGHLQAARKRAENLSARMTTAGWFRSDDEGRPFYHAAEAGFPVIALTEYIDIEPERALGERAKSTVKQALDWQLAINKRAPNPYDYARQAFQLYDFDMLRRHDEVLEGFFIPHANESGYWWQGESARLSSLAAAAVLGGRIVAPDTNRTFGVAPGLASFAQHQMDWTLGRNPFGISMLYGFGAKNPPHADSAGSMVRGGVSNGITGSERSPAGRGITFAPGPDGENWRWVEQWVPHVAWTLLAASATSQSQQEREQ